MSQASLGSFNGTVTPGVNMLDVFKQNERAKNPNSILNFGPMVLTKFGIMCPAGTKIIINDNEIIVPDSGHFELGDGYIRITSIVFTEAVGVSVLYGF